MDLDMDADICKKTKNLKLKNKGKRNEITSGSFRYEANLKATKSVRLSCFDAKKIVEKQGAHPNCREILSVSSKCTVQYVHVHVPYT